MAADGNPQGDRDDERRGAHDEQRGEGGNEGQYGGRGYEQVGQEQQGGWRGPGEMPGYREGDRRGQEAFLQPTSGGQVPSEMRDWERDPRAGERDHDQREREGDPRAGDDAARSPAPDESGVSGDPGEDRH